MIIFYAPLSISSYVYFYHKKYQIPEPKQISNTENEDIVPPEAVIFAFFFKKSHGCTNLKPLLVRTERQSTISILINSVPSAFRTDI